MTPAPDVIGAVRRVRIPKLPNPEELIGELRDVLTELVNEAKETNAHLAAMRADRLRERMTERDALYEAKEQSEREELRDGRE